MLAEQVEQRRLDRGDRVHGDAQVEGLGTAAAGVAVAERAPDVGQHRVVVADAAAFDFSAGVLEGAADGRAAWHLADAGVAVGVLEDHQVSGEERAVRAAEVQEHAVVPGDRHHPHRGDDGVLIASAYKRPLMRVQH